MRRQAYCEFRRHVSKISHPSNCQLTFAAASGRMKLPQSGVASNPRSPRVGGGAAGPGGNFAESGGFIFTRLRNRREHGWNDNGLQFQRRLGIEFADSIFAKANCSAKKFRSVDLDVAWQEWHVALNAGTAVYRVVALEAQTGQAHEANRGLQESTDAMTQGGGGARKNCA